MSNNAMMSENVRSLLTSYNPNNIKIIKITHPYELTLFKLMDCCYCMFSSPQVFTKHESARFEHRRHSNTLTCCLIVASVAFH